MHGNCFGGICGPLFQTQTVTLQSVHCSVIRMGVASGEYFVAFDTSPEKFAFLKEAGGDVIGAGTGAELRKALDGIYQGKILAEAPAAGEREPVRH